MINLGNVITDSTIRIPFNSFDADGASVTLSGFAIGDIKIYKDGSTTERGNTGGYTITTNLDGNGIHAVNIDLSNTAVTDYYEVGSTYDVAVNAVTIDGETVRFWVGRFEIRNAESVGRSGGEGAVQHFFKSDTVTVPSWATSVFCGAVGAGADGKTGASPLPGGGGGGGGYAEGTFDVAPGETLTITVGATSGANSSVSDPSVTLVTGNGGSTPTGATGGAGGTGSGGNFQATGGSGGVGGSTGGGGAAATKHGNGGNGGSTALNTGGGAAMGGSTNNGDGAGFGNSNARSVIESATGLIISCDQPLTHALGGGSGGSLGPGNPGDFMCGGSGASGSPGGGNGGAFAGGGGGGSLTAGNGGVGGGGGGGSVAAGKGGKGYCFVQFIR